MGPYGYRLTDIFTAWRTVLVLQSQKYRRPETLGRDSVAGEIFGNAEQFQFLCSETVKGSCSDCEN